ncbi:MAG TPA: class I SAM-dependent methyltransferase [Anaerolineaceae bacterium]|nr:class I SAM-dependent methyltransferase [Anaerolineaceae bacterium]
MQTTPTSDNALQSSQYKTAVNLKARIRLHQRFSTAAESWDSFVLKNLKLSPGEIVLELGCGNASQTRNNRTAFPASLRYFLVDFSYGMLQEAVSELEQDSRFHFSVQDAQALAFSDGTFDCITANHMLYHVPDIALALREIKHLLNPGGRLMAATNGQGHMRDLDQLLQGLFPASSPLHIFHSCFTLEEGLDLVKTVFGNATLKIYPSDLWVTEAQPLTDYVMSLERFSYEQASCPPQELTDYFQRIIDAKGGIKIRKSTGLLLATKQKL